MTSAEFSLGLSSDKSSSRVLRPPGGTSSNIFGNFDETPTTRNGVGAGETPSQKPKTTKDNIFGSPQEPEQTVTKTTVTTPGAEHAADDQQQSKKDVEEEDKKESEEEQENRPLETETVESEYDKNLRANREETSDDCFHSANSSPRLSPLKNPITGFNMPNSPRPSRLNLSPKGTSSYIFQHNGSPVSGRNRPGSPAKNPITGQNMPDSPSKSRIDLSNRGSFNPITGESTAPKKTVHTSTKVRQPPGGASSGLW